MLWGKSWIDIMIEGGGEADTLTIKRLATTHRAEADAIRMTKRGTAGDNRGLMLRLYRSRDHSGGKTPRREACSTGKGGGDGADIKS